MKVLATLLLVSLAMANGQFSEHCLTCMCEGYGCVMPMPPCVTLPWGYMCSPWKFSKSYWTDAGSIGGDFEKCGSHWECSKETVKAYVTHYQGTENTCENYARVHLGGPWNMNSKAATDFWNSIKDCVAEPTPYPFTMPTDAPTTHAPTTDAPTTHAPTTDSPTTEVPTSHAAISTEAPTTANNDAVPYHPRNLDTTQ